MTAASSEVPPRSSAFTQADSDGAKPHICICICTFQRPELLRRLLDRLCELPDATDEFTLSCVVLDNDEARSAAGVAKVVQDSRKLLLEYECEVERNFAVVRNRVVSSARGEFIAFIDDDEIPEKDWLRRLFATTKQYGCDGALGPVRPYFESPPPVWLERSRLCHRPVHPTGMLLDWRQTRTGNVLLRRDIFEPGGIWFDPVYRTGGEDVDFFKTVRAPLVHRLAPGPYLSEIPPCRRARRKW